MTSTTRMNQSHTMHSFESDRMSTQLARQSTLSKEPNPFEQSFGNSTLIKKESPQPQIIKPSLPSIAQINQTGGIPTNEGPIKLSPMILDPRNNSLNTYQPQSNMRNLHILQPPVKDNFASQLPNFNQSTAQLIPRPINPITQYQPMGIAVNPNVNMNSMFPRQSTTFPNMMSIPNNTLTMNQPIAKNPFQVVMHPQTQNTTNSEVLQPKKPAGGRKRLPTDGMSEKKIDFLERNRKAALKCRERKKNEVRNLEDNTKYLQYSNSLMESELHALNEEANKLRSLIISHASCPVAQAAGVLGEQTLPAPTLSSFHK